MAAHRVEQGDGTSSRCRTVSKRGCCLMAQSDARSKIFVARYLALHGVKYLRSSVASFVKVFIGRKAYFTPSDLWFRSFVCQLLGIRKIREITQWVDGHTGASGQALMVMYAIIFARACGLTYVHAQFSEIDHADRPMDQWASAWETHFNLGVGEVVADKNDAGLLNFCRIPNELMCYYGYSGLEELASAFHATIPEFRRKYYLNKFPRSNEVIMVCIHLRRGDVTKEWYPEIWTSAAIISSTVSKIKHILDVRSLKYRICIFSQGDRSEFVELQSLGVELFLDIDAISTMREPVEADVLVMANSALSWLAALIADGIKISDPNIFGSLKDWIVRRPDGDFDGPAFEHQLQLLIDARQSSGSSMPE
jgi:hypothetical protein